MKTLLRLAVLACASTAALALAGNALATQKLSVSQSATSLTVKISQAQTDPQPAKVTIYVPTGYSINTSASAGTRLGSASGSLFVRDLNIPLPLTGDVRAEAPTTNEERCATGTHLAVWGLNLSVAGQNIPTLHVHIDATAGSEAALGAFKLVVCLPPADVPKDTPGRSPQGAQLLDATFTLDNIFTVPAGAGVWKAITTPWTPGLPIPNVAGTVETRSIVAPGTVSITRRITSKKKRIIRISGKVTQGGVAVAGAQVTMLLNGKVSRFRARTNAAGNYTLSLKKTGRVTTTTFQARVSIDDRDVTAAGCTSPSVPGVSCVSATAGPFTALSARLRIRL